MPDDPTASVPVGEMVLVPRVPTEAMIAAFSAEHERQLHEYDLSEPFDYTATWSAMIAAAPDTREGGDQVKRVARMIWRETYRHDTLLDWHEVKPKTMHHRRTMNAARAAIAALASQEPGV